MKGTVIALDHLADGREIAALVTDGRIEDLAIDAPARLGTALPGAIFRAVAGRPMKGQGGVIVDLGPGGNGFLRDARGVAAGKPLLVQVSTVAERGKAAPVTRRLVLKTQFAIATPGKPGCNVSRSIRGEEERDRLAALGRAHLRDAGMGLIIRSAADGIEGATLDEDIAALLGTAHAMAEDVEGAPELLLAAPGAHEQAWRDWPDADLVDREDGSFAQHGLWDGIEALLSADCPLAQAGSMVLEPTRALVAVDVNTGNDTSPAAGLKANIAALRALPRALRLRGLGGQVVVDLAPFPKKERSSLEQVAARAMRIDAGEMNFAGWTPLGHMEFQRKRDRLPLKEALENALPDL